MDAHHDHAWIDRRHEATGERGRVAEHRDSREQLAIGFVRRRGAEVHVQLQCQLDLQVVQAADRRRRLGTEEVVNRIGRIAGAKRGPARCLHVRLAALPCVADVGPGARAARGQRAQSQRPTRGFQ